MTTPTHHASDRRDDRTAGQAGDRVGGPAPPGQLDVRELRKSFGTTTALDGFSLTVEPGRLCGFVGANGAGKTTTMRIVMGMLVEDGGTVHWGGGPVTATARRRFGYLPEERGLYPKMRVADQLAYFGRLHGLPKHRAAQAARHWVRRLGVAERADDKLETLSLGNAQRVQLAAALVHDPEVLILDEPFSGLDPVGVDALSAVLAERAEAGVAVLFSSHQLELVERLCHSVAIISRGRPVADGPVEKLRASGPRLLRVRVAGGGGGWAAGLAGAQVAGQDGDQTLLSLADDADAQEVLAAARRAGPVEHFAFERRSLAEIYREVVEQ